jgi:hypothetical protein
MALSLNRKRAPRVADMTTKELQTLIERTVDRRLARWVSNSRIARRREEIAVNAVKTRAEYRAGKTKRGTVQDLLDDLD